MTGDRFALAQKVADAVLYEGLVLYPYRKSALKNKFRWQFGVVAPRSVSAAADPSFASCEIPIAATEEALLTMRIRFLQLQRRAIEEPLDESGERWRACEQLVVDGRELLTWDEAVDREYSLSGLPVCDLEDEKHFSFDVPAGREVETIRDASGKVVARIVRERAPIKFSCAVAVRARGSLRVLRILVENCESDSAGAGTRVERNTMLRRSLIGCHALLGLSGGTFVSLLEPLPGAEEEVAKSCRSEHWWPVLAGENGARDIMLCAPIILYDYPAVAPESSGDFFDATEIDELLTLRVQTLTGPELREAAATDDHARRIIERVASTTPGMAAEMHGAIRAIERDAAGSRKPVSWEAFVNPPGLPSPENARVVIGDVPLQRGDRVRLAPSGRADAMDMFLTGRVARIAGVYQDLEDREHVAVTLDDDPAADLHLALGRYFYFSPAELQPLESEARGHG